MRAEPEVVERVRQVSSRSQVTKPRTNRKPQSRSIPLAASIATPAEYDCKPQHGAGTWVGAPENRYGIIPDRIEHGEHLAVAPEHASCNAECRCV